MRNEGADVPVSRRVMAVGLGGVCCATLGGLLAATPGRCESSADRCVRGVFDGVVELLGPVFAQHETEFAPRFDQAAFDGLQLGMTQAEVREALGEPWSTVAYPDTGEWWYYSQRAKSKNFHARSVGFDSRGRVTDIYSQFYWH